MPSPTYMQWRTLSSSASGLQPHEIQTRMLWCMATMVTGKNPDGSQKGS